MLLLHKKLNYIDPVLLFNAVANLEQVIFLDSNMYDKTYGRYSFITFEPLVTFIPENIPFILNNKNNIIKHKNIFTAIDDFNKILTNNQFITSESLPPFIGGLAGYFSYELGKDIEKIKSRFTDIVPKYCLGLYNKVFAFDHVLHELYIFVSEPDGFNTDLDLELERLEQLYIKASNLNLTLAEFDDTLNVGKIQQSFTQKEYFANVRKAQEYILDGKFYEINLTSCFSTHMKDQITPHNLYNRLRRVNQAPFGAYLDWSRLFKEKFVILSASPERFLKSSHSFVETRPIKGTIRRSVDFNEDQQLALKLASSAKDRSENIMIVDLLRNDLGKVCTRKSISVTDLCKIESYTNLHHMVSVINGQLKADKSLFDLFIAAFPGGSITGAPKKIVMEKIDELEKNARGVYCGSIGYISFNQKMDLNIAIRTMVITNNELCFYSGGAITLDSNLLDEYEELQLKAEKIFALFTSGK